MGVLQHVTQHTKTDSHLPQRPRTAHLAAPPGGQQRAPRPGPALPRLHHQSSNAADAPAHCPAEAGIVKAGEQPAQAGVAPSATAAPAIRPPQVSKGIERSRARVVRRREARGGRRHGGGRSRSARAGILNSGNFMAETC